MECAFIAATLCHVKTLVILHDYRRARYQSILALFHELRPYLFGVLLVAVCVALFVTLYRRVSLPVRAWALVVIVARNALGEDDRRSF